MNRFPMIRMVERLGLLAATTTTAVLTLSAARRPSESPSDGKVEVRIAELERRIALLEAERAPAMQAQSTVKAPFTVVDNAGKAIFQVDAVTHSWRLYSVTGTLQVDASAGPGTGVLSVNSAETGHAVTLDAFSQWAGIEIDDAKQSARVKLGVTTKNQTELSLLDASHTEIARMGEVAGGTRLEVKNADRGRSVTVAAEGTSPRVSIMGGGQKPIVELTQQSDGGGTFAVSDKAGNPTVMAYTSPGGGRIRVKNASGNQSIMLSSLNSATEMSILQGTDEDAKRASLMVSANNKPEFALYSDQKSKIINLLQGDNNGGRLTIGDAAGKVHALGYAGPDAGAFQAMTPSEDHIALLGAQEGLAVFALKDGPRSSRGSFSLTNDGKSTLVLMNSAHNAVVNLTEGPGGAGILQLMAASGGTTMEAGTLPSGAGIVRVGPQFKCAGSSLGGLSVPDCIKGHP